ncbi:MAG: heme-binding domain-containing protein [Chloroflexi bacterium]|nr:heme-binding domain-containing protein [Chloroflexota bacterium]MBP7045243.1 heme-binding domain-containing protein [Chloroflexota bacterium]
MNRTWKIIGSVIVILVVGLLVIQIVPYGRDHTNPAVVQESNWDSPQTRELAQRACFDCHSNETDWTPWYTSIAPASWLVYRDVVEGRSRLNFSEWNRNFEIKREPQEISNIVLGGEMPPAQFLLMHSEARLTQAEKEQLAAGLVATFQK